MKKVSLKTLFLSGSALLTMALTSCRTNTGGAEDQVLPTGDPTSEITIKFWHCLGHEKTRNLQIVANKFNEKYAGKYKIDLVKLAGGYDNLADSIKTKTKAGEIPALAMGYPDSFATYMTNDVNNSALYKLDNFINDPEYGYTEAELADFVPGFMEEGKNYQFEGTWSMPMYKSTEIMYYNASYMAGANPQNDKKFDKVKDYINLSNAANDPLATDEQLEALTTWVKANEGYTYNVPETWNEMFATARQIKTDMAAQGLEGQEFYPVGYDSDANMFISQFAQRGIGYTAVGDSNDPSTQYLFNNDQAKALLTEVVGYVRDKLLITKNSLGGSKYTNEYFNNLKSAMSIGSTGGSSYNVSANFRVKLAPVPYADGKQPKYIQQGPSICFFNNDDPYIHKGAWLFYKLLADPKFNADLALENSYDPVRQSSFETDSYKEWIAKHVADLKFDIPYHTKDLRDKYMVSPVFVGSDTARSEMEKLVGKVVNSNYSIDEALKTAYDACSAGY